MRCIFHAPLKPPEHPRPSGDRQMARLFIQALRDAGVAVEAAPPLRSHDGRGDPERQRRLAAIGDRLAARLTGHLRARPAAERPDLWFTYHLYHKAPDLLGPSVSAALGIPYVVAEASYAPKRRDGPWALGFTAAEAAIRHADRVLTLNSTDAACLGNLIPAERIIPFAPFIDAAPFRAAARARARHRQALHRRHGLGSAHPWLLTVAMMRPGDKLASYRLLAAALAHLGDRPWRLMVAGDGPARPAVQRALRPLGDRVVCLGQVDGDALPGLYAASDLYVWPAVGEAFGLGFLEAQAGGLPVVAGRTGGVPDVVADGRTGTLVPVGDVAAFAGATRRLLDAAELRRVMGTRAAQRVAARHDRRRAADRLAAILAEVCAERL